jgi:hypothetical protein
MSSTGNVISIPYSITHNSVNSFTVVFTRLTSGAVISTVGSPQNQNVISVADNYAASSTDRVVYVTASGKTITLPVGAVGHEFIIDNASSGDITVVVTGGGTIEKESSQTIPSDSAMNIFAVTTTAYRIY